MNPHQKGEDETKKGSIEDIPRNKFFRPSPFVNPLLQHSEQMIPNHYHCDVHVHVQNIYTNYYDKNL